MSTRPRVLVIGGGYAGLFALARLARASGRVDCTLVDRKPYNECLPLLPDLVGGRVGEENLRLDLNNHARKLGVTFIRGCVTEVNPASQTVLLQSGRELSADYLLLCMGTQTNFYGRNEFASNLFTLDTVADALRIQRRLEVADFANVAVIGGGYTGIELITNMRRRVLDGKAASGVQFHLVERSDTLLSTLAAPIRAYCQHNLERLGVQLHLGTTLEAVEDGEMRLSDGTSLPNAVGAWSAGVVCPEPVKRLAGDAPQGRVQVPETLRFAERCYAAGDTAGLQRDGALQRLSVQAAISEGHAAAVNILREISGTAPVPCRPADLGFVVPMANFRAAGRALGVPVRGRTAMLLHYLMCIYRSIGIRNRSGLVCDLLSW